MNEVFKINESQEHVTPEETTLGNINKKKGIENYKKNMIPMNATHKKMYHELAMKYHTDRGGSEDYMKKINAAEEKCNKGDCTELEEMYKIKDEIGTIIDMAA
jgi:hypothetical protein